MKKHTRNIVLGLMASSIVAISTGVVAAQKVDSENLSEAQAIEIALQAQPGTLHEIESETEQGKAVFEVEIITAEGEVELILDAQSGEVLARKMEDESDDEKDHHSDSEDKDD
jgi:uncharacterized membrane protein YkoI